MAKTKISEFSSTPGNNTDIDGINIAEGCAPSGINNAIRELMSQLKDWQAGTSNDPMVIGSTGSLTLSYGTANGVAYLNGSKVLTTGSALVFDGTNLGVGTSSTLGNSSVNALLGFAARNSGATPGYFQTYNSNAGSDLKTWRMGGDSSGNFVLQTVNDAYSAATTRLTADASGNLGLGVTPSAWNSDYKSVSVSNFAEFYGRVATPAVGVAYNAFRNSGGSWIYKTTNAAARYEQDSGFHIWSTAPSGTAGNAISFTQAMTLTATGNLGVGSTSPGARISLGTSAQSSTDAACSIRLYDEGGINGNNYGFGIDGNAGRLAYTAGNSGFHAWLTANTERARIDSSGNLLVGKTTTSDTVVGFGVGSGGSFSSAMSASNNSTVTAAIYSTGASAYRFYVGLGGTVYATSTTISSLSDARYKENVQDLDVGLDAVMQLKPRKFDWKAGKGKDIKGDRGWIAQEFEQVFPDMIDTWKDEAPEGEAPYKSVRADLIPVLVKALQEMKQIVDAQAARIAVLEAK